MGPFHLRYALNRRQRLLAELPPWIPAIAGSLGFGIGATVLSVDVSAWFLLLLILPLLFYRGLAALLLDVAIHSLQSVELRVDSDILEATTGRKRLEMPLAGIIQVYRDGSGWTVLHLNRTVLTIPADVITQEQVEYLKSFALAAAADRRAARSDY